MLPIFIASIPDDYEREFVTGLYTRFYSPMLTSLDKGTQPFVVCDG